MNKLFQVIASIVLVLGVVSANAGMDAKSIAERTMPVGKVCVEGDDCGSAVAAAPAGPQSPEDIYNASCAACHGTGALGAPKFGDAGEWGARIADKGLDTLISNAIGGINAMPAMGTCASCSEDDIAATVQYMVDNSK